MLISLGEYSIEYILISSNKILRSFTYIVFLFYASKYAVKYDYFVAICTFTDHRC